VATPEQIIDHNGLSTEQFDLIQRFEADFNAIQHFLQVAVGIEEHETFTQLVLNYAKTHAGWGDADLLRRIAKIRNVIVHDKTEPFHYPVVPTVSINEQLRKCKERLLNPARAVPTFQRTVEPISVNDTLTKVLKIINHRDYSQFPVRGQAVSRHAHGKRCYALACPPRR
jgi:hypothetical protein